MIYFLLNYIQFRSHNWTTVT